MDKIAFNKLKLQEQVQYINDQLSSTELSVTKVCEAIGIDRSTVRKRFKNGGYEFNADINLYKGDKKQVPTPNKKPPKDKVNAGNTNALENRVKALESQMKALQDIINTNAINTSNTVDVNNAEIDVTIFEGDTVTRAYRLDAQVQKEFKIFCKKNSEYKVQDLISSALQKFMDETK